MHAGTRAAVNNSNIASFPMLGVGLWGSGGCRRRGVARVERAPQKNTCGQPSCQVICGKKGRSSE